MTEPSFRSQLVTRRTYSRPKDDGTFETWDEIITRVIQHQQWLWERAAGKKLTSDQLRELQELRALLLARKVMVAGRTLWLGGTEVTKRREATNFNCSYLGIQNIRDIVDAYWLLMQGCGIGFSPITGVLSGFTYPIEVEVIRSLNKNTKGVEVNTEIFSGDEWTIKVGDSAEAWVKAVGKILANKRPVKKLILDFSEIRAAGVRLKGYGWISSGDETIAVAFPKIAALLSKASGRLLSKMEILDIMNWLGTTLSSRRSAEIALMPYEDKEASDFIEAKTGDWWNPNPQRTQSNNSVVFSERPSKNELKGLFQTIIDGGGSEPGFINGEAAVKRAPFYKGVNPCGEILLGNTSFCNLVEVNLPAFNGQWDSLVKAVRLIARANYRQTCVDLRDGILQDSWHEMNNYLRLTGVGLTGIVGWERISDVEAFSKLKEAAHLGVNSMAKELGLPLSKNTTTVKPSGTLSKLMDTTEGVHKPLGQFILNNIVMSQNDELLPILKSAGYRIFPNPNAIDSVLVTVPVEYPDCGFQDFNGTPVNLDSALTQLERYKFMMDHYVDHNCSITVSYDPSEANAIVNWLHKNWDSFVGVSWLFRNDPTKTAADLGYKYLPQEVVTKEIFDDYARTLKPVRIGAADGAELLSLEDDGCASGMCPVR